jgi:indolepyruvate ferredoxin oxidoreductase
MLLAGIGGTGVITVSAILAEAAALDGNAVVALDQTGLAQKNGAVLSHVRISRDPRALASPRIGPGEADVILSECVADRKVGPHVVEGALHRLDVDEHDVDAPVALVEDHVDPLVAPLLEPADASREADDDSGECA